MSQRFVVVEIDGAVYPENLCAVPDWDDARYLVSDFIGNGWEGGNDFDVEYWWYEIGPGESGSDDFFRDEELLKMWESEDFEKALEERGFEAELIESGNYTVDACDLPDNEDEEDSDWW